MSPRESVADGLLQGAEVTDFIDGLQGSGQVAAIVVQHGGAGAQAWLACRCLGVGAKVIVEAPTADAFAQAQDFRRILQAADVVEQAVEFGHVLVAHLPLARLACLDHGRATLNQQTGRAAHRASPDRLVLDLRVEGELRPARLGQSEADGVTEIVVGKPQAQTFDMLTRPTLHGHVALAHAPADRLGAGPERRLQAALGGQGVDYPPRAVSASRRRAL